VHQTSVLLVVVLCSLPGISAAAEPGRECLLSFAQARYDVCAGRTVPGDTELEIPSTVSLAGRSYRVVKLGYPVTQADRAELAATGAEILGYLPFDAFLVRTTDVANLNRGSFIWTGDYLPAFKVGPIVSRMIVTPVDLDRVTINVVLHHDERSQRVEDAVSTADLGSLFRIERGPHRLRLVFDVVPADLGSFVATVAPLAEVAAVQYRQHMGWSNSQADWVHQSWSPGSVPVFDRGIYGCGQVVAYMDSGLDFNHCAFEDTVNGQPPVESCSQGASCPVGTPDFSQRKVALYYKWSSSGDALGDAACSPGTGAGHGTHVGGSIAGDAPGSYADCASLSTSGDSGDMDGTAPGAWIIHQEMGENLDYINSLGGTVYHSLVTAHASGARIHSNSWGGGCCFLGLLCILCSEVAYDSFARDADLAIWENPDLVALYAAGNDGSCCDPPASVNSPGVAKSVITVGATGRGSSADALASFSSRGHTNDRRTKPTITAQGEGIESTASDGSVSGSNCSTCTMGGTSMATPTAAGLTALIRDYLARGFYPSGTATPGNEIPNPSAALVKAMLANGARDMTGTPQGAAPNQEEGWGRIHLDDVLFFAGDSRRLWIADNATGLETGGADEYQLSVGDGQPLKVVLVWSDYPGAENANPALVNDLRLEVVTPSAEVLTQKIPVSDPPNPYVDHSTSGYDDRNTVEGITLSAPTAGVYTIRVRAMSVPMGPQPFALTATGQVGAVFQDPIFADDFESGNTSAWSGSNP
jgi:hypothetical protein